MLLTQAPEVFETTLHPQETNDIEKMNREKYFNDFDNEGRGGISAISGAEMTKHSES